MLLTPTSGGSCPPPPGTALPFVPEDLLRGRRPRSSRRLNTDRCIAVSRVLLGGGSEPWTTVIAKSCDEGRAPTVDAGRAERLLFEGEFLNYRFLGDVGSRFDRFPRMLARVPDAFYLEDLGPFRALGTDEEMMAAIAETFVLMHEATSGGEHAYREHMQGLASRCGIAAAEPMLPGKNLLFQHGSELLLEWASVLTPAHDRTLSDAVSRARETIEGSERWRTFVHDDLSSRRQSVIVGGEFRLLDFERAHYNHRLLDLAMVMVGKLEVIDLTVPIHIHPSLPPALADVYRLRWETVRGQAVPDAEWRTHLFDAMVYHVVVVLFQIRLRARHFPATGMVPTIASVLARFVEQARSALPACRATEAFDAFRRRLIGGSAGELRADPSAQGNAAEAQPVGA